MGFPALLANPMISGMELTFKTPLLYGIHKKNSKIIYKLKANIG